MSEKRWTPGPWTAFPNGADYAVGSPHWTPIARELSFEDANLIAAAPELYECLEIIVSGWEGFGVNDKHGRRCREALARARGEEG